MSTHLLLCSALLCSNKQTNKQLKPHRGTHREHPFARPIHSGNLLSRSQHLFTSPCCFFPCLDSQSRQSYLEIGDMQHPHLKHRTKAQTFKKWFASSTHLISIVPQRFLKCLTITLSYLDRCNHPSSILPHSSTSISSRCHYLEVTRTQLLRVDNERVS
jgi:hypothetical protein